MTKKIILPLSILMLASACAPKNLESVQQVSSETKAALGCENFESRTWAAVDQYLMDQKQIPVAEDLKQSLNIHAKDLKSTAEISEKSVDLLNVKLAELVDVLLVEVPQQDKIETADQLLGTLIALEIGDQTTTERAALTARVQEKFNAVKNQVQEMQVSCQAPAENPPENFDAGLTPVTAMSSLAPAVFGARFAMATAYQSCSSLDEDPLTLATPNVQGIVITGTHSDKIGRKREVGNLKQVLSTHPYYKNVNAYGANCVDPRKSPMIYDYGGKPYALAGDTAALNFFKNSGSGTAALGMDCSGFVYSSLAAAGLRIKPKVVNPARWVSGISATSFIEPTRSGYTCMEKIAVSANDTLKAGDVVAVHGHIVIIDTVGSDPFGIKDVKTAASCSALNVKDLDFVVAQSNPSKAGLGINRFEAKEYARSGEGGKMKDAFMAYAKAACLAKFSGKVVTPSVGTSSIVRHKLTPECMGTRIALSQQACVQSCPQLK
jgi:hypothetical protein